MGISIIEKPLEWLSRIYEAILIYKEDFFINLEDDVWVMNKVNIDDLKYDINGCHLDGGFNNTISNYIRKRNPNISKTYIGGFGGCIFRTLFFKEILKDKDVIKKDLEIYYKLNGTIAADAIISFLTYIYGGTIGTFPGYSEIRDNDYKKKLDENKIEILHDYKELYESKEMRDNTINLVTPYNSDMAKKIMICYKNKYYK